MDIREQPNPFSNARVVAENVASEVYLRQEAKRGDREFVMSRSELLVFNACPSKWLAGYKFEATDATEWGELMDIRALQPHQFDFKFAIAPATYMADGRKKGDPQVEKKWNRNADTCRDWEAAEIKKGKRVIKADEKADSDTAVAWLFANERARSFIGESKRQVLVIGEYSDKSTGLVIPVKTLIDIVPSPDHALFGKCLGDFKTARNAAPRVWEKQIHEHGYHVQGAINLDLYVAATSEDRVEFRHVIQENVFPWQPATRIVSADFINLGRSDAIFALRRYCECLETNSWPDYDVSDRSIGGWLVSEPHPYMIQ